VHPLLHAELLHVLASMGHGDELAIVDGNFPAAALAQRLVHLSTTSAADALDAVLSVFPLDTVAKPAALTMRVIGHAKDLPDAVRDFAAVLKRHSGMSVALGNLEREAFYERARNASPSCEPPTCGPTATFC
jgi:L-fucose mutarotase